MIEVSRALARLLRAVLRKCVPVGAGRGQRPVLLFSAGRDGLRVRAHLPDVGVEYYLPGSRSPDGLTLTGEALVDFEGRKEDAVRLENIGAGRVQASWQDGGLPQVREYDSPAPEKLSPWPEEPRRLQPTDTGLLKALDDASQSVAREGARFAVQKIQLRGGSGEVIATDGKQLLVQGGFGFPWKEDLLVPAVNVFGCREVTQDAPPSIGRTDKHVCVTVGPWRFFLAIDADGRFPHTEGVTPRSTEKATRCQLAPQDAAFLLKVLQRLPGGDEENAPLTLDLGEHVALRVKGEGQSRITEVVLAHSTVVGPPVCLVGNRHLLARVLQLGFLDFCVHKPDLPVVATDRKRLFVWMPLSKDGALPASEDALRITSSGEEAPPSTPRQERRRVIVNKPATNETSNGHALPRKGVVPEGSAPSGMSMAALIEEAQSIMEVLHDAQGRVKRLLAALKLQRKQSRLMASTLASLKQLQQIQG